MPGEGIARNTEEIHCVRSALGEDREVYQKIPTDTNFSQLVEDNVSIGNIKNTLEVIRIYQRCVLLCGRKSYCLGDYLFPNRNI